MTGTIGAALSPIMVPSPAASLNRALADKLGLRDGDLVRVRQGAGEAVLPFAIDDKLPADCIRIPAARAETS